MIHQDLFAPGLDLMHLQKFEEAIQYFQEILKNKGSLLPSHHHLCLTVLGDLHDVQGIDSEAEKYFTEAICLAENEDITKEHHCNCLLSLATHYRQQGRYVEAEETVSTAMDTAESSEENDRAAMRCKCFLAIGILFREQGRYDEAEDHLLKAISLSNNLETRIRYRCLEALGILLREQRRFDESDEYLSQVVSLSKNEVGLNSLSHIYHIVSWCEVLIQKRQYAKAESQLEHAENVIKQNPGFESLLHINCLRAFGVALHLQGKSKEAREKLMIALSIAQSENVDNLTQCNIYRSLGEIQVELGQYREALSLFQKAQDFLIDLISSHRKMTGIPNFLDTYADIFKTGRKLCEQLLQEETLSKQKILWKLLAFWDAEKCISIRERLRLQISQPQGLRQTQTQSDSKWISGPEKWQQLFKQAECNPQIPEQQLATLRTLCSSADAMQQPAHRLLEFPDQGEDERKSQFCQPMTQTELNNLLPTDQSVIIGFYFDDNDLVILPIRRDIQTKQPTIICTGTGLFRLNNVRDQLEKILELQQQMIPLLEKYQLVGKPPHNINKQIGSWQKSIFEPLYSLLQWDDLLSLLTYPEENREQLHLTFIPDDILYQFPLHAACNNKTGQCLFEEVASINYALSLRTLELQFQIDRKDRSTDPHMRGTVFAYSNPDAKQNQKILAYAHREVANLVDEVGIEHLWIHGDQEPEPANRKNMRHRHHLGNLLWNIGHGGISEQADQFDLPGRGRQTAQRPSILLADGLVSDSRMVAEQYDFSSLQLNHYSCCTLGKMTSIKSTQELEGWIASLTLLSCRRVSSALWELCDAAAADFGQCWIKALKEHAFAKSPQPHTFSVAFKQALAEFRALKDGHWNHEFYWAPYILYGLP